jgi:hypothetical protein
MGCVTAKAGSQSIMASLIGTTVGIGLSSLLAHDTYNFAMGFCVLTVIHQGCNYISLKSVPLAYFNRQRLQLVMDQYLESDGGAVVPDPAEVAHREVYVPLISADKTKTWLKIGAPLDAFCPVPSDLESLLAVTTGESYIICLTDDNIIHLVFLKDAGGEDLIRGMLHASLLRQSTTMDRRGEQSSSDLAVVQSTHEEAKKVFPELLEQLHVKGWKTGTEFTTIESSDAHRLFVEK